MFGEKLTMGEASIVALFSITVVFLVLLLISCMIRLIAVIINKAQKPKETPAPKSAPVEKSAPAAPVKEEKADDSHLVAVITAAVAACLGKEPGSFVVKSITPLNTESDWSRLSRTSALH